MTKPFSLLRDKMSASAKAESERLFQEAWENMSILKRREQLARLKPRNTEFKQ